MTGMTPALTKARETLRTRTLNRIEDLEFLLSMGEDRDRALKRIGWTRDASDKALRINGRRDLMASEKEAAA